MVFGNERLKIFSELQKKLETKRALTLDEPSLEQINFMHYFRIELQKEFPCFNDVGKWCYEDIFSYYQEQVEIATYL